MKNNEYKDDDVIVIGGSDWKPSRENDGNGNNSRRWKVAAIFSVSALLALCTFFLCRHIYYSNQFRRSRPDSEVLSMLATEMSGKAGVNMKTEEAMGVKMKIYALNGLKAHFADTVPDYSDSSIFLITRSSDYRIKNGEKQIIGDFIKDGTSLSESLWRAGFMVIKDGNAQIGISRSRKIRKEMIRNEGSMFRQMALISAGTRCDEQFILKGKVTRCAYARDMDGNLFFIETVDPETLYGFADALIEYGFIDAIYVTGGSQPDCFYREQDGSSHGNFIDDKPHELIVWSKPEGKR